MINHWPSADGLIGTADDKITSNLSTYGHSSPNSLGSYSYIVTSFGLSQNTDPLLFANYDTATFVQGFVTIDPAQFVANDVPLIKDVQFGGTELFPGHGPYSVKLTGRRGGAPAKVGNAFTFSSNYDFQGTFSSGTATATNAHAEGLVVLLDAANFANPDLTGVPGELAAYVRSVAVPVAQAAQAAGLICGTMTLQTAGSVPGNSNETGYFPPLDTYAVVLALDLGGNAAGDLRITSAERTASGLRLRWNSQAGQTYSVRATTSLASPFDVVAANLSGSEYIDTDNSSAAKFYRISTP